MSSKHFIPDRMYTGDLATAQWQGTSLGAIHVSMLQRVCDNSPFKFGWGNGKVLTLVADRTYGLWIDSANDLCAVVWCGHRQFGRSRKSRCLLLYPSFLYLDPSSGMEYGEWMLDSHYPSIGAIAVPAVSAAESVGSVSGEQEIDGVIIID